MLKDIIITSLETITGFDITTGAWKFTLDELQNASIANSEDKQDVAGKQGRKLTTLKRNKTVTVSGANGVLSGGLMEMQVGSNFEDGATNVRWTDYLTVTGNAAATKYKAVGTEGDEIKAVYLKNEDGTLGKKLTQGAEAKDGVFTYTPGTKALAFTGVADGTNIVVFYDRKIQADKLENLSDKHSGKCALYIDALGEDKCSNVYRVQFYVPKADFSGEFTLDLGDNQTVHNFEAESLAGACGSDGALWTYTVFGANTEDIA
nr:MAG TPA: putative structural protein [Caudoviricetes sp.]